MSFLMRWVPSLLWMAFIYYWSSKSSTPANSQVVSKLAHVVEYSLLSWLVAWGLGLSGRWALLAWVMATAYAATDELHQAFTPERHPQVLDVLLDSAAAAFALQGLRYLVAWRQSAPGALPHLKT